MSRNVPIKTFADWEAPEPGYCEVDFVAHCGGSMAGRFVHTLTVTDVASGWTECAVLLARDQDLVVGAFEQVRDRLPVELRGLDTDNDSAFVNQTVFDYCQEQDVEFTRSRPHRKNDQAWVEQKNGAIVRQLTGNARYAGVHAARVLSRLYATARLYANFFQPSFKLKTKLREGARIKKTYLPPATPCDRLLASKHVPPGTKKALRVLRDELDPLKLLKQIRDAQADLAGVASEGFEQPPEAESLEEFLAALPRLWKKGEVRATHWKAAKPKRTYRTRRDPFEDVWPSVVSWLELEPDATAKSMFERLTSAHPGHWHWVKR